MASGENVLRHAQVEHWILLDNVTSTDNGVWIDTTVYPEGSIHVKIANTATVQLRGSDDPTKPADASHELQIDSDITASDLYSILHLPRWLKARVSAHTSGRVDVWAVLRRAS
jgi:hypothetical protein